MPQKIKSWHPRVTGASWRSDPLKQGTDLLCKHPHVQEEKQWLSMGMSASPGLLRWARNPSQGSLVYTNRMVVSLRAGSLGI